MSTHLPPASQPTQIVPVDARNPDPRAIAAAAAALRAGLLVAFPTETVYGLGANARDAQAVEGIFRAKGRPASDPLIVHIAELDDLGGVARNVPPAAYDLARQFWPGALTLVLPRHPDIPATVSAGMNTVAVRLPSHPIALALIRAAGLPVAAPSANRFARPSPTTATHVYDDLAGRIAMILDGGPATIGVESTVLDLAGERPRVLRPGGIPLERLRAMLPDLAFTPRYLRDDEASSAPGGLLKHYSPDAPLTLVEGADDAVRAFFRRQADDHGRNGTVLALLVADDDLAELADLPCPLYALGPAADLERVASELYAGLRALDRRHPDAILARSFGERGLGLAIRDRLVRAAEGRVLRVKAPTGI